MNVFDRQTSLEDLKEEVSDIVADVDGMQKSNARYWDNSDVTPWNSDIPKGSKTRYYLEYADKRDRLEDIQEHIDPLLFEVKATFRVSTGLFSSHTHWIRFRLCDLTRVRMLAQGNEIQLGRTEQTFEGWSACCDTDHDRVQEFEAAVDDRIDRL